MLGASAIQRVRKKPAISGEVGSPSSGGGIRHFGDYDLQEEIGRGGMGVVFKAWQRSLTRWVALKMIRSGQLATESEIKRFDAEAKAAAKLNHPNIVPIYDFKSEQGYHYFSMRLVEGKDLGREMQRFTRSLQVAVRLVETVARAAHHAHTHGVVHRDLKPSNILIDADGNPHLTDFGLAKIEHRDQSKTVSGTILGTIDYMAPEQAQGRSKHVTSPADIFSLGVILYQLITDRLPFTGPTPHETLQNIIGSEPPKPSSINPRVDAVLEGICLTCIAKKPEERYGSADALADDLEAW